MLADRFEVVIGVDTHKDTHTAVVVAAATGAVLGEVTVPADRGGFTQLVSVADGHGLKRVWAVEGTGSYGAGLCRFLSGRGETVVEIARPLRRRGRRRGKSDALDAVEAAREALHRPHQAQPRTGAERAALAELLAVRRAAVDAARVAQLQLHALVIKAPEEVRARFDHQSTTAMVNTATRLRVPGGADIHTATTVKLMRALARRYRTLRSEAADHHAALEQIVRRWRPDLLERPGVGPIVAATVLCAWSHPGRCRNEAAFASLAGVAPLPASSGNTVRHRLNRGGDRQLNQALHTVVLVRLRRHPATLEYVNKRRGQGMTGPEIRRCLSRYIARELYRQLEQPLDRT
ncbi:MAG: IS110 family transposase [Actinomycetota bacterium]|nr:IS110 family transposase [Actinomycetota bacterium]